MKKLKDALEFYSEVISEEFMSSLLSGKDVGHRAGIFHSSLVIWLMIAQRLKPSMSLSQTIEDMRSGIFDILVERATGSIRARGHRIASSTGGYSRARERVSLSMVEQVFDRLCMEMNKVQEKDELKNVYVIDGSTLQVACTDENIEEYSQHENQHGKSHYPVVRIGVATNALTGVAVRPSIGAFTGKNALGENALAEELLDRLPEKSIVIGDRYYGSFRFAYAATSRGHDVLVRIKESKGARSIVKLTNTIGEEKTRWNITHYELNRYSDLPADSAIDGKFVWMPLIRNGKKAETLILFTTLDLPASKICELYALRWNVELDLRDIKSTLEMEFINAKSPDMVRKQIILGVAAFNLIRRVIGIAAEHAKLPPRSLSFSMALHRAQAIGRVFLSDRDNEKKQKILLHALTDWKPLLIKTRTKKRPPEPRKVWARGRYNTFSVNSSRERERLELLKQSKNFALK